MPPILLCWTMTLEVDVDGTAAEAELPHQYSIIFCCPLTDGNSGTVWQNGIWHGSAYVAKVCHQIPPRGKKWWGGGWVFQQQQQRVTSAGADFYKHGMQALVYHWWKCIANGGSHVEKYCFVVENLFYQADLLSELQSHFQNSILRSQVQSGLGIIYQNRHLYWKTVICNCYMQ